MTKTMDSLYTVRDVARIFGLNESRVRYWAQTGFINPSGSKAGRRVYTFRDLVGIKAAKELLDRGIPLQRVRRSIQALREALPQLEQPLTKLRICADGDRLVVEQREGTFEAVSGQLLLEFGIDDLHHEVAEVLELNARQETAPARTGGEVQTSPPAEGAMTDVDQPTTAYTWFLRACACDQEEDATQEAIEAYHKAIELDPSLAAAHTNLGNLHYQRGRRDEARRCYERACLLEPEQAQAHYNLANLYEEEGDLEMAVAEYRRALVTEPDFADAHFNLALALEAVGSRGQAKDHWRRYLDLVSSGDALDPEEEWTGIARSHLARLEQEPDPKDRDRGRDQDTTSSGS